MGEMIERLLGRYEQGSISRRELILALAGISVGAGGGVAQPLAPIPVLGFNHVTLFVSDRQRSVEFYQRVFEMPVQSEQQGGTNLHAGDGTQFLGIFQVPGQTPRIDHFCLAVRDFDPDRILATLRENGVEGRVRMRGEVPEVYFTDPDGLSVQVQDVRYCGGSGELGDVC